MTTYEHQLADSDHSHEQQLIKMHQKDIVKNIYVHVNGNIFFKKHLVVNQKQVGSFDGFLDEVTRGVKAPFGAVRKIYTPNHGHRVNDFQDIKPGMHVVVGGYESFRRLTYNNVGNKTLSPRKPTEPKRPIVRMNVPSKYQERPKAPKTIYVYSSVRDPAKRLLIPSSGALSWDHVLNDINLRINNANWAINHLFDSDSRELQDYSELQNGGYYVAVNKRGDFKKGTFGQIAQSSQKRTHQPLPPIKHGQRQRPAAGGSGNKTYTKLYNRKKQHERQEEEETTIMGASAATGYRPLRVKKQPKKPPGEPPTHEGESVFHAKPVKVKRSGGHRATVEVEAHPPEHENDGVFKANNEQVKAEEVEENEDTKVDLPIDQVPADEVVEENIHRSEEHHAEEVGELHGTPEEHSVVETKSDTPDVEHTPSTPEHKQSTEDTEAMIAPVPSASTESSPRETYEMQQEESEDRTSEVDKAEDFEELHETPEEAETDVTNGNVDEETVEDQAVADQDTIEDQAVADKNTTEDQAVTDQDIIEDQAVADKETAEEPVVDDSSNDSEAAPEEIPKEEEHVEEESETNRENEILEPADENASDNENKDEDEEPKEEPEALASTVAVNEVASAVDDEALPQEDAEPKDHNDAEEATSPIKENDDGSSKVDDLVEESDPKDAEVDDEKNQTEEGADEPQEEKSVTPSSPTPHEEDNQNLSTGDNVALDQNEDGVSRSEADGADVSTKDEEKPEDLDENVVKDEDASTDETAARFVTTRPASEEPAADEVPTAAVTPTSKHSIPNGTVETGADQIES